MWFIVEALFFQYRSSFDNLNAINANPILFIQNVITNTNKSIHVNPPESSGSLPEMQPNSRTPGSEMEPPGYENTKK